MDEPVTLTTARVVAPRSRARRRAARVSGRLARLGDEQHEGVLAEDGIAVAELGRDVALDGDARQPLDEVFPDHARVHGGAAGHNGDRVELPPEPLGDVVLRLEGGQAVRDTRMHRVGERAGLLVDLLEHEVVVAALLRLLDRPFGGQHLELCGGAVRLEEGDALPVDAHDLFFPDQRVAPGN